MFLEEIKFHIDATLKIVEKKILQSVLIHISYQTNSTQFVFPQIQSIWMGLRLLYKEVQELFLIRRDLS